MNASLIILALTVASFLLGFLRDLFIARAFGLSWQADLIFVALILFFPQLDLAGANPTTVVAFMLLGSFSFIGIGMIAAIRRPRKVQVV